MKNVFNLLRVDSVPQITIELFSIVKPRFVANEMSANKNRLLTEHKQLAKLQRKTTPQERGWTVAPVNDNLSTWTGTLYGPASSPYEGGSFTISLDFTTCNYPHRPPTVRFVQVPWHPNVYVNGNICVDFLSTQWTPAYRIESILSSLQSLLDDPNCSSPANPTASRQWLDNRAAFCAKVKSEMERFGCCTAASSSSSSSNDDAQAASTAAPAAPAAQSPTNAAVPRAIVFTSSSSGNDPDADDDF